MRKILITKNCHVKTFDAKKIEILLKQKFFFIQEFLIQITKFIKKKILMQKKKKSHGKNFLCKNCFDTKKNYAKKFSYKKNF